MSYEAVWSKNQILNDVEHIKLQKDGLDVIQTIIDNYSKEGYFSFVLFSLILISFYIIFYNI